MDTIFAHRPPKSDKGLSLITEEDMDKFLEEKAFYCKRCDITITKHGCITIQKMSDNPNTAHPSHKCTSCPKFSLTKKDVEQKTCKLHKKFAVCCTGKGYFERRQYHKSEKMWTNKEFCTNKCGVLYNHFKSNGWEKISQIPVVYKKA